MSLQAQVPVAIPKLSFPRGAVVRIPVNIGNLSGKDVTSFEFVVGCDTTVLRLSGVDQKNSLSSGLTMFANNHVRPYGPGRMKVVCASSLPLADSGVLVYITGVVQNRNGTSSLHLSNFILNTGTPPTSVTEGFLTVKSPKVGQTPRLGDSVMTKK